MRKIDRQTAEHYQWKDVCDGWHFVKRDDLSVIAEKMPPTPPRICTITVNPDNSFTFCPVRQA